MIENPQQFDITNLLANIGFKDVQMQELRSQIQQLTKTIESLRKELEELKPKKKGATGGRNQKGNISPSKT